MQTIGISNAVRLTLAVLILQAQKKAGTDAKKLVHEELSPAKQRKLLGDDYWDKLQALFYEAMKEGKVDQRNYS